MDNNSWSWSCLLALLAGILGMSHGNDPWEGNFPLLKCVPSRNITGCNESLADAFEKTEAAQDGWKGNKRETRLFLYTCLNRECAEYIDACGGFLPENTNFNKDKELIVIVGGYISTVCDLAYFREFKILLLARDCYNVILVDWPWGNYYDIYLAMKNAVIVGKQIAFALKRIVSQTGFNASRIHIAGHSIGAHIAGFAGKEFQKLTNGTKVGRITGLDPSGSAYVGAAPKDRLDKEDAEWVDVWHTNAGDCLLYAFGIPEPIGHADYYINGGTVQPSCYPVIWHNFLKFNLLAAIASFFPPSCYHFQAVEYFKASITPCDCQFIGVECPSVLDCKTGKCTSCGADGSKCAVMGLDWGKFPRKRGPVIYCVKTTLCCDYCDNKHIDYGGFPTSPVPEGQNKSCYYPTKYPKEQCGPIY